MIGRFEDNVLLCCKADECFELVNRIVELAADCQYDEREVAEVRVALYEALACAIRRGHEHSAKSVRVRFSVDPIELRISVTDARHDLDAELVHQSTLGLPPQRDSTRRVALKELAPQRSKAPGGSIELRRRRAHHA
jgi:anti-sigma regulatory factor (Ser/Thr protein kinase)